MFKNFMETKGYKITEIDTTGTDFMMVIIGFNQIKICFDRETLTFVRVYKFRSDELKNDLKEYSEKTNLKFIVTDI